MQVYNWIKFIPDILYPRRCLLCGAPGSQGRELCTGCAKDLPLNHHPCAICALPLPANAPLGTICGGCSRQKPVFERCYAALLYDDTTGMLISRLKFNRRLNHAGLLAGLLGEYLEQHQAPLPELILPVPLHSRRLRERGYNQALEIGRHLGRHFGLPLSSDRCSRIKSTPAQTGLERKQRQKNLRQAFRLNDSVRGTHIALLDDVVTTGSTVTELAKLLKRSGASRVDVWAVARTPEDRD
ncbi:MAG: ComF family protein [Gammaproteobacteria bacterium]|nr:ComF family protein [Gammaproteobacteria bacterium]